MTFLEVVKGQVQELLGKRSEGGAESNDKRQHALLSAQKAARRNQKLLMRAGAETGKPTLTMYMRFTQMHHGEISDMLAFAAQQWVAQGHSRYFKHVEIVPRFQESKPHPDFLSGISGQALTWVNVSGSDFSDDYERGAVMVHLLPASRGTSTFPIIAAPTTRGLLETDIVSEIDLEGPNLQKTSKTPAVELVSYFIGKLSELERALDTKLGFTN